MTKRPNLSQGRHAKGGDSECLHDRPRFEESVAALSRARGEQDGEGHEMAGPQGNRGDALTRLANDIAHDFNNLITSILGNAEALRQRLEGVADAHAEIATIRGEAQRAAAILRRLTAVSDEALISTPVASQPPLPQSEAPADDGQGQGGLPPGQGGTPKPLHVLLAEDDAAVRRIVSLTLRKNGYEVTACSTGEEAWQAFRQAPMRYDLLVTDLSMPVLDGASLIQRVRLLHPRLRALLISGYCDDGQAYDLVKSGAVGFLPKPFNTSEFLSFVRGQMEAA